MTQQTAVELIINELRQLAHNPSTHLGMGDIRVTQGMIDDLEEQAKQIEKEQRINAQMDMFHHFNDMPYGMAYLEKRDSVEKFCENYGKDLPELRYKDGTPMRKYNSLKLQELEQINQDNPMTRGSTALVRITPSQTAVEWLADKVTDMIHESNHIELVSLLEQAKEMEKEQNKKEKCWVIRNSAKHILCVHKTINDEQLKDYRKQGLYIDEYVLSDCFISINPSRYNEDAEQYYNETYGKE